MRIVRLSLLFVIAVAFGPPAAAADPPPPPPEIQAILDKMKNHQQVTPDEMAQFQTWTLRKSNQSDINPANTPSEDQNQAMPSDVQEILARLQQGQRPSAAELARLKQWGAQTRSKKGAIINDVRATGDLMKAAGAAAGGGQRPPSRIPRTTAITGTVTGSLTQEITSDKAHLVGKGTVTYPAKYTIQDKPGQPNNQFHLRWAADPTGRYTAHFELNGTSTHEGGKDCPTHTDEIHETVDDSGSAMSGQLQFNGEVVAVDGGKRPYLDLTLMMLKQGNISVTCQCGGGSGAAPAVVFAPAMDRMRGDVPFNEGLGNMPTIAAGGRLMDKFPDELKTALNGATFNFDTAGFRTAREQGGPFSTNASYHYKLKTKDATSDSTTRLTFQIKLPPQGKIVVTPDPPTRAQQVTLHADVKDATQYHWHVTGGSCPNPTGAPEAKVKPKDHDGQDWRFLPLCDFHVELQAIASDGQELDSSRDVTLKPRSDKWHVDFPADPKSERAGTGKISYADGYPVFNGGMNRCSEQSDTQIPHIECDWIHRKHGDSSDKDYSDSFTTDTVPDDGPFQGYGYVKSQKLTMKRQLLVNAELKGGPLTGRNRDARNGDNFERVHQQVFAHETMHSVLARKSIQAEDPAQQVEGFVSENPDQMTHDLNVLIGHLDAKIGDAASEDEVGKALQATNQWNDDALLCLPGAAYLLDCGPLYALGTGLTPAPCSQVTGDKTVNKKGKEIKCPK